MKNVCSHDSRTRIIFCSATTRKNIIFIFIPLVGTDRYWKNRRIAFVFGEKCERTKFRTQTASRKINVLADYQAFDTQFTNETFPDELIYLSIFTSIYIYVPLTLSLYFPLLTIYLYVYPSFTPLYLPRAYLPRYLEAVQFHLFPETRKWRGVPAHFPSYRASFSCPNGTWKMWWNFEGFSEVHYGQRSELLSRFPQSIESRDITDHRVHKRLSNLSDLQWYQKWVKTSSRTWLSEIPKQSSLSRQHLPQTQ